MWIIGVIAIIALVILLIEIKVVIKIAKWIWRKVCNIYSIVKTKITARNELKEIEKRKQHQKEISKQIDIAYEEYKQKHNQ